MDLEPTYSETAVDSLFCRALAGRLTPEVRAELKAIGIDLDRALLAAYPQPVWERGVQIIAERVFGNLPREEAFFEVGRLYMAGFQTNLLGKAVVQLTRLIGPERTLLRMQRNQRTTNNYAVLEIEKLAPTRFQLQVSMSREYLPRAQDVVGVNIGHLLRGVYSAVLEILEVKNPRVTMRPVNVAEFAYEFNLSWDA